MNQYYDENSEVAAEYDYSIKWVGMHYHTPFMNPNYWNYTDEKGRILVNEYFQITSQDPNSHSSEAGIETVQKNIFCYGDASSTPAQEIKNIPSIRETSSIVAHNIYSIAYNNGENLK